ncbi:phosphoribosylanthranilate isomerase [Oligoflexia bacterium]|nr:phosphoribosylanthranilate isomerase [Oligoflexia bacterium]
MKLKVCGMRSPENIAAVAMLAPDYMGFIFYERSKRFVGEEFNADALQAIAPNIKKVGVFVNATTEYVLDAAERFTLDAVQLHGDEEPSACADIKQHHPDLLLLKAFGVDDAFAFETLTAYQASCDLFLFDTKTDEFGGSGRHFNWQLLTAYPLAIPFFLSGGLGLDDIQNIKNLRDKLPYLAGVDLNSKVEVEPGLKSIELVKACIEALRI